MTVFIDRTGEIGYNRVGSKMTIINYNGALDISVIFENGVITKTSYSHFKEGAVLNPYDKTVEGIGFFGEGEYKARNGRDKLFKQYMAWGNMVKRCYNKKSLIAYPSYKGCTVSPEWHNFQNFAQWYDKNFYAVKNEKMNLDKDLMLKGNKIYGPDTCVFVPESINKLIVKKEASRGPCPLGVSFNKKSMKYEAYYSIRGKRKRIGLFDSSGGAFYAYKEAKEKLIKEVAEEYRDRIPEKLYYALLNYKIEIND